jgi:hypothetical protein
MPFVDLLRAKVLQQHCAQVRDDLLLGQLAVPLQGLRLQIAFAVEPSPEVLYSPAVRELFGRYGNVNQIPPERRQEFLDELTTVTGRPLPAFKPTPLTAVVGGSPGRILGSRMPSEPLLVYPPGRHVYMRRH